MAAFEYAKLIESMQRWGFTIPLVVRATASGRYEIIDGEHRWRVAGDLGIDEVPFIDVSPIGDDEAIALGIALNELRGRHDPKALGKLLEGLLDRGTPEDVLAGLPFTDDALKGLTGLHDFDWKGLSEEKPKEKKEPTPGAVRWVERTFRMPPDADEVLQQALERMREAAGEIEDWKALELVAAEYLAGS